MIKSGEKEVLNSKIHNSDLLNSTLWLILGLYIAPHALQGENKSPMIILLFLIGIFVVPLLLRFYKIKSSKYIISDKAFYLSDGILNNKEVCIPFEEVEKISTSQSFFQKKFNSGTVVVYLKNLKSYKVRGLENTDKFEAAVS